MQNDVLATGIMSFVLHEIVYFGRSIPWMIIDRIPYFNKYKIQNVRCVKSVGLFDGIDLPHAAKNSHRTRAVVVRPARPAVAFHCGASSDLVRF